MEELPLVGIAGSRTVKGADKLSDRVPALRMLPLDEALRTHFESDAHFITYRVVDSPDDSQMVRCNKPILSRIRDTGANLLTTCLVFDWDVPGHKPWTPDLYEDFGARLVRAADNGLALATDFSAFHTTTHGARLIYVLEHAIPVDEAEKYHRGVVLAFERQGIHLDKRCSDWTHLFRLPRVLRNNRPTWEDPFFETIDQLERRLSHKSITPVEHTGQQVYGDIEELDFPKPDASWCERALTETADSGRQVMSDWARQAKRRLKGREAYPILYEHKLLGRTGHRDSNIHRYAGQVVSLLFFLEGTTPELVYALFVGPLLQLEPDEEDLHKDWTDVGWKAILRYWARELAKEEVRELKEREERQDAESLAAQVLNGVRLWCRLPEVQGPDSEALRWVQQHLIAYSALGYYVMRRDGHFDSLSVKLQHLPARVRELGMDSLIPLECPTADGKGFRKIAPGDLVSDYGTAVSAIEGAIDSGGGKLRNPGHERPSLVISLYRRKRTDELDPCFDRDVDRWLKMFGGRYYAKLCEWISFALAFEEGPIAALSIVGHPGCGKKMLTTGLGECVDTETVATSKEFGRFQSGLLRSPFLSVNEGFHRFSQGSQDTADFFRTLVAGDPLTVEQKGRDTVVIRNPVRMIFSANNLNVLQTLTGNRDLSPEDRAALAVRLVHLDVGPEATRWLNDMGGIRFTKGWIQGDDGSPSDYRVARHFLWLYEHRAETPPGRRLLVEGDPNRDVIRILSTRSGSAPDVIECLVRMIESPAEHEGMVVEDGKLYVTTNAVVSYHRVAVGRHNRRSLDNRTVGEVLKGLTAQGSDPKPRVIGGKKARWKELDPLTLLEEAYECGYDCTRLQTLARTRMQSDADAMLRGLELNLQT